MTKPNQQQLEFLRCLWEQRAAAVPKVVGPRSCPFTATWSEFKRHACSACVGRACRRYAELGLDDDGNALPWKERPSCGARTRRDTKCAYRVVPGKRRCRFHGGLSTGPVTIEGKQKIAEAQRKRWAEWRRTYLSTAAAKRQEQREPTC